MSLVAQELTSVCEKWQNIGEELGLKQSSLKGIDIKYSGSLNCLTAMLPELLKYYSSSWKGIIDALRSSRVGESQLADQLEVKYCHSEFIDIPSRLSSHQQRKYVLIRV